MIRRFGLLYRGLYRCRVLTLIRCMQELFCLLLVVVASVDFYLWLLDFMAAYYYKMIKYGLTFR